jgi:hypothetical protein
MDDHKLHGVKEELRREAALRSDAVGPLAAKAMVLREYFALAEELQAIVGALPVQLELLDSWLRAEFGQRWWDHLSEGLSRPAKEGCGDGSA